MDTRKQIRVYVDIERWNALKTDNNQSDTDTLKRLLAELEQLRRWVGQLSDQDIGQISTMVAALSEIHTNPLIALGMCLERYRQISPSQAFPLNGSNPASTVNANDFIDNSGEF